MGLNRLYANNMIETVPVIYVPLSEKKKSHLGCLVYSTQTLFSDQSIWRSGIQGCRVYRCAGKEKTRGGVGIWVKDSIISRERHDMKEAIDGD